MHARDEVLADNNNYIMPLRRNGVKNLYAADVTMPCNLNDNRDNNDNGKNGRNCGCHKVTYNRDNKITSAITVLLCVFYDN